MRDFTQVIQMINVWTTLRLTVRYLCTGGWVVKQTLLCVGDGGKVGTGKPQPCLNCLGFKILQQFAVSAAFCQLRFSSTVNQSSSVLPYSLSGDWGGQRGVRKEVDTQG